MLQKPKKIYIFTGESSGDNNVATLVEHIKSKYPETIIWAWGGKHLKNAGAVIRKDIQELSFMGYWQVLLRAIKIFGLFRQCKKDILLLKPDVLIFVDYSGFNLRIAKWTHKRGFRNVYFIPPKVWAWKEKRLLPLKKHFELLITIFPFEKNYYNKKGVEVLSLVHPLYYSVKNYPFDTDFQESICSLEKPLVCILPGSRKQEISYILPEILKYCKSHPQYNYCLIQAPTIQKEYLEKYIQKQQLSLTIFPNSRMYDVVKIAQFCICASGTATLELGLLKSPQVVVYKTHALSYAIAKRLIKLKYISLVNLILEEELIQELIQEDFTAINLAKAVENFTAIENAKKLSSGYSQLEKLICSHRDFGEAVSAIMEIVDSV